MSDVEPIWRRDWGIDSTGRVERHLRASVRTWLRHNPKPLTPSLSEARFLHAAESIFWEMAGDGEPTTEVVIRMLTAGDLPEDGDAVVYRHFSGSTVLYIGYSRQYLARQRVHRNVAAWWADITRITVERYADSPSALLAEAIAITQEKPLHNKRRPE